MSNTGDIFTETTDTLFEVSNDMSLTFRVPEIHDQVNPDTNDHVSQSEGALSSLWKSLQHNTKQELFGYFDISTLQRLRRVSHSWGQQLPHARPPRGILFVETPKSKSYFDLTVTSPTEITVRTEQDGSFLLRYASSVKHLVMSRIHMWQCQELWSKWPKVHYFNCRLWEFISVPLTLKLGSTWWGPFGPFGVRLHWEFTLTIPWYTAGYHADHAEAWQWQLRTLDKMNCFWPDDRLQDSWLREGLDCLNGAVLRIVQEADRQWTEWRRSSPLLAGDLNALFRKTGVTSKAISPARELDTFDCVFFGQLLTYLQIHPKTELSMSKLESSPNKIYIDFVVVRDNQV